MSIVTGNRAEEAATQYLESKGFKIIARNWRRPRCEIDIVASEKNSRNPFNKEKTIYFVEVKYRKSDEQGSGLDYITAGKLKQMEFAARMWVSENNWEGSYELGAIEVAGEEFEISEFQESLVI